MSGCCCMCHTTSRISHLQHVVFQYYLHKSKSKKNLPPLFFSPSSVLIDCFIYRLAPTSGFWPLERHTALNKLGRGSASSDLWRRLIALCCVWDSVALRCPTKITVLSPPLRPRFQSSLWCIEENCPPPCFSSPSNSVTSKGQ